MYRLLMHFALTPLTFGAIVTFLPSTSFYNPTSFKDGKLPCPRQTVVFPDSIMQTVTFDSDLEVNGLILPDNGEFIIDSGASLFGPDLLKSDTNCTRTGNVYFKDNAIVSWVQPNAWSSVRFNKATPDAERVPCFDDTVQIPANAKFTLQLPRLTQYVQQFKIGDQVIDTTSLTGLGNENQVFLVEDGGDITVQAKVEQCTYMIGCPCQRYPLKIECQKKICPVPTCVNPVRPIGHCCQICGGVLSFEASDTFDYEKFKEFVDQVLSSYSGLVYHLGRPSDKTVQLVVVEEQEYTGVSSEVVNRVNYLMEGHWALTSTRAQLSATPLSKYGLGGKIFISMFFLVVFVLGLVYAYYYKIPDIRQPLMGRAWFDHRSIMSRFERRSESVVSLTRRDSSVSVRPGTAAGFKNPLYDSKRGSVAVTELKEE